MGWDKFDFRHLVSLEYDSQEMVRIRIYHLYTEWWFGTSEVYSEIARNSKWHNTKQGAKYRFEAIDEYVKYGTTYFTAQLVEYSNTEIITTYTQNYSGTAYKAGYDNYYSYTITIEYIDNSNPILELNLPYENSYFGKEILT